MKGFLRKVMLIASLGATLTFFGCQKDYTQDINKVREDLTAQLEQLESDLTGAINSVKEEAQQYADAAEQAAKDYADAVADAKAAEALAAAQEYADNAAAKAAADVKAELLTEIQSQVADALKEAKEYTDEQIDEVWTEVDALEADIAALTGRVSTLEKDFDALRKDVNELQKNMSDAQLRIAALEEFKTSAESRLKALEEFQATVEPWMENVDTELANLKAADEALQDSIDNFRKEYAEKIAQIDSTLTELRGLIEQLQEDVEALEGDVERIDDVLSKYGARLDAIEEDIREINEALVDLAAKIGDRLTSISLIPETYVDGIPAISIPSIVYQTSLSVDDETEEMVYSDIYEIWSTARDYAYVRYHLSPAHVTVDGLKSAEYLIEKAQNVTKAYVDNDILSIDFDNLEVNDRNELVVPVKKVNSSSLCFETGESLNEFNYLFYSAALQLGIADELLLEGEKEANVVSEYSMVIEEPHIIHIAPLRDDSREIHGYECETFYYSYEEAQESEPAAFVNFDSELDLYTMVTSCIHNINSDLADPDDMPLSWLKNYLEDEGTEAAIDELRELGFEFRFIIPTVPFEIGDEKTDQQAFIKFKDGSDAVVVSTVPGEYINNEAAVGRTPVIRVELIDTNNDNEIVDVQWFKIRWVKQTIPAIDLGNVADFDYVLGCTDFSGSLNWKQINQYVLARLGVEDGNVTGISHKEFVDYYMQEGNENITWEAVNDEFEETETDITFNWDVNPDENPTTSVLTWNMTVEQIGEVIDEILENGSVQKQIKVTINPKAGEEDYAGAVTFTLTLNITFEDRPAILGYNEYFWNTPGQLAQVQPIGFNDATNEQPGVLDIVRFNYNVLDLFNKLEKYDAPETWMWTWGNAGKNVTNFMYNIDPTAEQVAAYAEKGYDLVRHWACRMWDIQFSADQTLNYAPKFANGQKFDPENGGELGYSLIRNGELDYSSKIVPNEMGLNWYSFIEQDLSDINFTLADDTNGDFEGAVALLNPANVTDENRKDVAVDIWVRINQFNYYKVSTFNVWFVEPVTLPEPTINGKLEDINMNPTSVTVANPFGTTSGLKDFQGELINSNEKLAYYGIYGPNWDTRGSEYILVDITEMTTEDGYTNITVNPNLNPNNPEDIAKMRTAAECKFDVKWDGNKLTVTNQTGHQLTQTCHLWVKASYGHAYGNFELWVPVEYVPNQN